MLRQALHSFRKDGIVSVPGVYAGFLDNIPFGLVVAKALTIRSGQTHVQRYLKPLLDKILENKIDPSEIISHRLTLAEAPAGYEKFQKKED